MRNLQEGEIYVGQIREWNNSYLPPYIIEVTNIYTSTIEYQYIDDDNKHFEMPKETILEGTKPYHTKSTNFKSLYDKLSST